MKNTKILATLGPASSNYKTLKEMVQNGLNAVRINLSHSDRKSHENTINLVKKLRHELNVPLAIVVDTRGPEVRVEKFKSNKVTLKKGQEFTLFAKNTLGDEHGVSVTEPKLFEVLKTGNKIYACDGLITMKITAVEQDKVITKVLSGGEISNHKSLFFPNVTYNIPYLSKADRDDIIWAINQGVDYFALSFVNSASNVEEIKKIVKSHGGNQLLISKIESKLGVKNIDEIIAVSDGIMVARGDLGVEMPMQKVPVLQKQIINKTLSHGKFVITATEMLESMTFSIRPTRAEVSDVANAVLDGSSAIMLSGETSVGINPPNVVKTMAQIATQTEKSIKYKLNFEKLQFRYNDVPDIISYSTVATSFSCNANLIAVISNSGRTPKLTARFHPNCPILAITDNETTFNQLSLINNVVPVFNKIPYGELSKIFDLSVKLAKSHQLLQKGDLVVISSASRYNDNNSDFIKIVKY